jgi:CDP-glycerol glycerophosphotransferase (TagB/SpsB family)
MLPHFLSLLGDKFHLLIKEHPGVVGFRRPSFYKDILKIDASITVCPSNISASTCLQYSDAVFVWTGSIGFEAALRAKPVISPTNTYYFKSYPLFMRISIETTASDVESFVLQSSVQNKTDYSYDLLSYFLAGHLPGHFQNDGSFNMLDSSHLGKALQVAYDIDAYIQLNGCTN